MPSINSSVSIDPSRLQRAVAVAEDAVRNGPYPSAVITVANAEATILTHAVSHPERAPAREDSIFLPWISKSLGPHWYGPRTIYNLQSAIYNLQS
jgi:hypothetical protein